MSDVKEVSRTLIQLIYHLSKNTGARILDFKHDYQHWDLKAECVSNTGAMIDKLTKQSSEYIKTHVSHHASTDSLSNTQRYKRKYNKTVTKSDDQMEGKIPKLK